MNASSFITFFTYISRVNRHVCDVINFFDKRHFELSTGDVIMAIAVSFSLRFVESMLNMS